MRSVRPWIFPYVNRRLSRYVFIFSLFLRLLEELLLTTLIIVCTLGCTQCTDITGVCLACQSGFTQDANDKTKCNALESRTSDGITVCPDGSFSSGAQCSRCSPSCRTCNGPSSNQCILCAAGSYRFNGNCVTADSNGVCQGTNGMIADNNKNECDSTYLSGNRFFTPCTNEYLPLLCSLRS